MPAYFNLLCAFLLCLAASAVQAQSPQTPLERLPESVAAALKQAGIPESHVGIEVRDLTSGTLLLSQNAERTFNPASVMKLVSTLAALDTLGPAHTFHTRVYSEGTIKDGVLDGNLVLQGGGDPSLTVERFWLLLRALRNTGLREIRGQLVIDPSFYAPQPAGPPFDAYPLHPYNAAPAALSVNFNVLDVHLKAADGAFNASFEPATTQLSLDNQAKLSTGPCNGWRDQIVPLMVGSQLILKGRFPESCADQTIALTLLPAETNAFVYFQTLWQELGGLSPATWTIRPASSEAHLLLDFPSTPLSQLIRDTNKFSNNLMAKMLFLNLGAQRFGPPADTDKGIRAVQAWLAENSLKLPGLVMENGAGLSRRARISAASLSTLLVWAANSPVYHEFAASLPAAGLEGTQRNRLDENSPLLGRAWLKTGTLDNARNLAGYVLGLKGERLALVFLVNDSNAQAAGNAQRALLDWASTAQIGCDE